MDRNSILNPENTKSVCEEVKNILQDDNEGLTDLFKAVSGFSNDSVLQGSMYDSLKKHVSDYNLVIDAIKMANALICLKTDQLAGSVGCDYLDGNTIIGKIEEYDRCISNAYQNASYWRQDKARFESEHPFSLLDPVSWNNPYSGPNPYDQDAEDYKKLREIWNRKAIRYDNINKSTTNLFCQANTLFYNAKSFLNIINSRTVDGINVVFEKDYSARHFLTDAFNRASETLEAEKDQDIKDNYYTKTLEEIDDFWLNDDTFDNPYWYQDQTKRALAIEYLRQEIELTGPYPLLKEGQLSEEEKRIREYKTVLINYLANAPHGSAFDYLLPALENTCSCFGVDLYDGIGYTEEDSFILTEELLDLLIKNEERRIGKEFGYWCDRGGGDIIDGALTLGFGVVYAQGTPQGESISYDEQLELDITAGNQQNNAINEAVLNNNSNYAQRTYSNQFSPEGQRIYSENAGERIATVDDLANAIQNGRINISEIPIEYIVRDGRVLILNTRSSQALTKAGVPRYLWNAVDRTGNPLFEDLLSGQLSRNRLTNDGISTVRPSGGK